MSWIDSFSTAHPVDLVRDGDPMNAETLNASINRYLAEAVRPLLMFRCEHCKGSTLIEAGAVKCGHCGSHRMTREVTP